MKNLEEILREIKVEGYITLTPKGKELIHDMGTLEDIARKYKMHQSMNDILSDYEEYSISWLLTCMGFNKNSRLSKRQIIENLKITDSDPSFIENGIESIDEFKQKQYLK